MFGKFLALVANNAFGLPFSVNTLVIITMVVAIIIAGAAWFFAKNAEGFFE